MMNGWNHCKLLMTIYIGYWVNLIGCSGHRYFQLPVISITRSALFLCYQVVFDVSLQKFLDSYLRLAPRYNRGWLLCIELLYFVVYRPHDQINFKYQDNNRRLIEEVNRRVFMVFLRLSTHKESKVGWITCALWLNRELNIISGAFYISYCLWQHNLSTLLIWYTKNVRFMLYLWTRQFCSVGKDDFKHFHKSTPLLSRLDGYSGQYLWG